MKKKKHKKSGLNGIDWWSWVKPRLGLYDAMKVGKHGLKGKMELASTYGAINSLLGPTRLKLGPF